MIRAHKSQRNGRDPGQRTAERLSLTWSQRCTGRPSRHRTHLTGCDERAGLAIGGPPHGIGQQTSRRISFDRLEYGGDSCQPPGFPLGSWFPLGFLGTKREQPRVTLHKQADTGCDSRRRLPGQSWFRRGHERPPENVEAEREGFTGWRLSRSALPGRRQFLCGRSAASREQPGRLGQFARVLGQTFISHACSGLGRPSLMPSPVARSPAAASTVRGSSPR